MPATTIKRLVKAYKAGRTLNELAAEFHIHRTTVRSHLERAGLPRRRVGRKLTEQEVEQAVKFYGEGWSLVELGQHFRVDDETVRQALRRVGVKLRAPGRMRKRL